MPALLHLRSRVIGAPLLLAPEAAGVIATALADRFDIPPIAASATVERYRRPARSPTFDKASGIAVLPVVGSMVHRGEGIDALSGIVSYTALQNDLGALIDNPAVRGIILDIDSGGGEAAGLYELGEFVRQARLEKPVWAIANTVAASAAYWLASSADRVIAAPQSTIGSIGVVVLHQDAAKLMEKRGIVSTFVFAGKHKVDGNPFEPLPSDVRDAIQGRVDLLYSDFVDTVAQNRRISAKVVRDTEAAIFSPEQAIELGLVDGIGTLAVAIATMRSMLGALR